METNAKIYKTTEKQRDATKRYKVANKNKKNDPDYKQNNRVKKYEIEFIIAFIDE